MNKEKQLEEMAKTYEEARLKANETLGSMNEGADRWYANAFYNAGYRKTSEIAEEICQDIIEPLWDAWKNDASQGTVLLVAMILETITYRLKNKYTKTEGGV